MSRIEHGRQVQQSSLEASLRRDSLNTSLSAAGTTSSQCSDLEVPLTQPEPTHAYKSRGAIEPAEPLKK